MNLINIYDQFYFIVIMKEIVKERNFTIELENDFVFIQQNIRANILSSKFYLWRILWYHYVIYKINRNVYKKKYIIWW